MKRSAMLAVAGALILGLALPALAQQKPSFNISWRGEMRVHGIWYDNITDWTDTSADGRGGSANKDSNAHYFQRWRIWTTVESADKKARAVWGLEIGDIVWGSGGGANASSFGGGGARIGPGAGGEVGVDGVNIETKTLYLQFEVPGVPGSNLLLGAHNIVWLSGPAGAFMDDDGFGVQFAWKAQPVDVEFSAIKLQENLRQSADDNDMYMIRVGVNATKDIRFTVEGMVVNQRCFANSVGNNDCTDSRADLGDTFWVGGTVGAKAGTINIDGQVVYGQREMPCPTCGKGSAEESGWGIQGNVRLPVGPVQLHFLGQYTSGDKARQPGVANNSAPNNVLTDKSDKLPIPLDGASWLGGPFIADWFFGARTLGSPGVGQPHYADPSGLWVIGGSATFAVTPALSLGGGVAYIGATEDNGRFGDNVFAVDGGLLYSYNAQLSFQGLGSYMIPDQGDNAWALGFRTRFGF